MGKPRPNLRSFVLGLSPDARELLVLRIEERIARQYKETTKAHLLRAQTKWIKATATLFKAANALMRANSRLNPGPLEKALLKELSDEDIDRAGEILAGLE